MNQGAGPALFRLVRFWSRRWTQHSTGGPAGEERRLQDIAVLDAIETVAGEADEVSVADVAHQLGIDRSGASRFLAATEDHGHVRRGSSDSDGRRVVVTITTEGRELLDSSHVWQEQIFTQLTEGWDPDDVERFGRYLRRLANSLPANAEDRHV